MAEVNRLYEEGKEDELQELKFQLSEQKIEMERKLREKERNGAGASEAKADGTETTALACLDCEEGHHNGYPFHKCW